MLNIGKLDSEILKKLVFDKITYRRPEVLTRPGIGEDCAVVDYGEYECVLSTDPITAAVNEIGRLAVYISCNDVASNGVEPLGLLLAVLLPVGTTETQIAEMMCQAGQASEELGVEIIGGHTEITAAVVKPVITSTCIGRGTKDQHPAKMAPGDYICMTKWAGLEGTAVIASDKDAELLQSGSENGTAALTEAELAEAKALMRYISVVREGVLAGKIGTAGMHDVTEGGILGAVWELCTVGGVGAELCSEHIPILPVTQKLCARYDIDPLRLISSGCMAMVIKPENIEAAERAMAGADIPFSVIGRIHEAEHGIRMDAAEIAPPGPDELYKAV